MWLGDDMSSGVRGSDWPLEDIGDLLVDRFLWFIFGSVAHLTRVGAMRVDTGEIITVTATAIAIATAADTPTTRVTKMRMMEASRS